MTRELIFILIIGAAIIDAIAIYILTAQKQPIKKKDDNPQPKMPAHKHESAFPQELRATSFATPAKTCAC